MQSVRRREAVHQHRPDNERRRVLGRRLPIRRGHDHSGNVSQPKWRAFLPHVVPRDASIISKWENGACEEPELF